MNDENKIIIYQVFTRLFGNNNNHCVYNGDIATNGCGKMADFTLKALGEIKKLGQTCRNRETLPGIFSFSYRWDWFKLIHSYRFESACRDYATPFQAVYLHGCRTRIRK